MKVLCQDKSTDKILTSVTNSLQEYADIINSLEKNYSKDCEKAAVSEEISEIKIIADKAKEFAENRKFYKLHNAVGHAWSKIESFKNTRQINGYGLPFAISNSLTASIGIHTRSLEILVNGFRNIVDISRYSENSNKKDLKRWAEALEAVGNALEDNLEFFSLDLLEEFQTLLFKVIQVSQQKSSNSQTRSDVKDSYRIRVRTSAGFLSSLIDFALAESDEEDCEMLTAIANANHPVFFED
ncbi:hypothetical protein [Chamaesiphon polymorphus]|uniref:Uncharacterized protein n=1 Tax=Chamaesiphon polymorphus CCALA 037 TaxID=2107692 RepID=A0A2T1GBT9_9CYAN|nr:hypothetical protein [Chamaesiphon polymorphus]PSB54803.1 hypothetical protein C7B77_17060 [Chamaesiphon polymorphus CCALA 037]